jgi:PmbA protein
MLGPTSIQDTLQRLLHTLPAGVEGEAFFLGRDSALTRFANNEVHQNVAERNALVVLRAALGRRTGSATTNDLGPDGLARLAETAVAIARLRPENPDFPGLAEPRPVEPLAAHDEATATCTPERRARAIGEVCGQAAARGLTAAGAFETERLEQAVASTRGVQVYHAGTRTDFQCVAMSADSSGWAQQSGWRIDDLDVPALGREAIATAERGRNPRPAQAGVYPVVLAPYAVQDVVHMLGVPGAGAQALQESRSWMSGRQGQTLMSPQVSIWDDGRGLQGCPAAFDSEGTPKQRVDIVRAGVVGDGVYDTYSAAREPGRRSTGHALAPLDPLGMNWGPLPSNLYMAPGTATDEELIAATERGVYVTRFWYTRVVHPREVIMTGLTRDGTFWIENGALAYPIQNLRFTQAYVQALAGVEGIGRTARALSAWQGATTVPALRLAAFNFTGVSPRSGV